MAKHRGLGFTMLELLVVVAIIAVATAGVGLALRDTSQTALEREGQRLAVLFESARAQSRASGLAVSWQTTPDGFRFEGLSADALPERWLSAGITVRGVAVVQLGPEPIIGPQAVELFTTPLPDSLPEVNTNPSSQINKAVRVVTDGLRPFSVAAPVSP